MMNKYQLRDYREADIPAILSVIKTAFAEYRGVLDPPSSAEAKTLAIVRTELAEADALVMVFGEEIIGCIFYRRRGESCYIDRLSVLPAHRNQGLARAMLAEVEHRAKTDGYKTLTLSVRLPLKKQQAYYRRIGYEFRKYYTHEGYREPTEIVLQKLLD